MPTIVDIAVCLRQWDWSETSQTVSLFSREHGIIRAVAKGSRRADPRFSGGLEAPTLGEAVAIIKPGPVLATLTAWDLRETFPAMRRSLSSFHAGMYAVDLAHHAMREHDPHPPLFDALLAALRALRAEPATDRLALLRFQWAALGETGYRPQLDRDAASDAPLKPARVYAFAPHLGGFTADPRPRPGVPPPDRLWRVRAETLRVLRALDAPEPDPAPFSDPAVDRAGRLLAAYFREILGRDPASAAAVFGPNRV
ncbi:MAG: DNA repair protein RecO [Phycisphaerales bacterium]